MVCEQKEVENHFLAYEWWQKNLVETNCEDNFGWSLGMKKA